MRRLTSIWKLYILYSTILLVLLAVAGFALQGQLKVHLQEDLRQEVLTIAKLMSRTIPDTTAPEELSKWCREYRDLTGARVTLMDNDGKVLCDSDVESIIGEGRLDRPEVNLAIEEGLGSSVRHSDTLEGDMFYASLLVKERDLVIRLAVPIERLKALQNRVMLFFALTLYLAPILAMVIAYGFAKQLQCAKE